MTTATCTGSKIDVFQIFEEYEITEHGVGFINVKADDGVIWHIPVYHDDTNDTFEVTDANGNHAIFVI
jgi:hypothetical protein